MFMFPFSLPAVAAELAALDEDTVDTVRPSPANTELFKYFFRG